MGLKPLKCSLYNYFPRKTIARTINVSAKLKSSVLSQLLDEGFALKRLWISKRDQSSGSLEQVLAFQKANKSDQRPFLQENCFAMFVDFFLDRMLNTAYCEKIIHKQWVRVVINTYTYADIYICIYAIYTYVYCLRCILWGNWGVFRQFSMQQCIHTPSLNDKIDSGKSHLQDLARWWRTSKGVDIPKISQFYWALFEKTRFLCFFTL